MKDNIKEIKLDKKGYDWIAKKLKEGKEIEELKDSQITIKLDNYIDNVELFWNRKPFFYDKSNMFWMWDIMEHKYELVDDVTMMLLIDSSLGLDGQTISTRIKSNYMESFKRIGRTHIPDDAPTKWIQFKDKAFSLESGKIYDVKPNYFFTNPIPYELGETTNTPIIDKLITEWVGKDYVVSAYEIIAYCCLNNYPIHLMFCLIGCGRNGKSKFLGLIQKFIGKENICSTELDTLLDSRFESFKLYKKLVCLMGETNFGTLNKTSLLKKLTGQDLIGFEFKNKKPFDSHNYAKILIASNSLPTSLDTSEGFYRRWMILDFPNIFPEGHDILNIIPEGEYNNLALKVTKILPKLLKEGRFTNQGTIQERKMKYILSSNPLPLFVTLCCNIDNSLWISYNELYTSYIKLLKVLKKRRVSRKEFKVALEDEGFWVEKSAKNVDGEFKSGYYVDGLNMSLDKLDFFSLNPTQFTYKECKGENREKNPKSTNQQPLVEIEELITPFLAKCKVCGVNPSHFSLKGDYFCSKDCANSYKVNK